LPIQYFTKQSATHTPSSFSSMAYLDWPVDFRLSRKPPEPCSFDLTSAIFASLKYILRNNQKRFSSVADIGVSVSHWPCAIALSCQHPLAGQRAANLRLLANHWPERKLVTQWRHGWRAMRQSVCNAGASNGGRSLCVQISRERSYPPANILIPPERQLIALQLCRWQFLYNETLQQTSRPLLSKLSKRR